MKNAVSAVVFVALATLASSSATLAANVTVTMDDLMQLSDDEPSSPPNFEGRSRDAFLLEMEGNDVNVPKANVFDYSTHDGKFIVQVGLGLLNQGLTMMACLQSSKEARGAAIAVVTKPGDYNIKGTFDHYQEGTFKSDLGSWGTLILTECTFEQLP